MTFLLLVFLASLTDVTRAFCGCLKPFLLFWGQSVNIRRLFKSEKVRVITDVPYCKHQPDIYLCLCGDCAVFANICTSTFCLQLLGVSPTDKDEFRNVHIWQIKFSMVICILFSNNICTERTLTNPCNYFTFEWARLHRRVGSLCIVPSSNVSTAI